MTRNIIKIYKGLTMAIAKYKPKETSSVNFDGRKFKKVICYTGKNLKYSVSAITILLLNKIQIEAVVGEKANIIWNKVADQIKTSDPQVIVAKRPWETTLFDNLKLNCPAPAC